MAGLQGREQRRKVLKAEKEVGRQVDVLKAFETEKLEPFKAEVSRAEAEISAYDRRVSALNTAEKFYEDRVPYKFVDDPLVRGYLKEMYQQASLYEEGQRRLIENPELLQEKLDIMTSKGLSEDVAYRKLGLRKVSAPAIEVPEIKAVVLDSIKLDDRTTSTRIKNGLAGTQMFPMVSALQPGAQPGADNRTSVMTKIKNVLGGRDAVDTKDIYVPELGFVESKELYGTGGMFGQGTIVTRGPETPAEFEQVREYKYKSDIGNLKFEATRDIPIGSIERAMLPSSRDIQRGTFDVAPELRPVYTLTGLQQRIDRSGGITPGEGVIDRGILPGAAASVLGTIGFFGSMATRPIQTIKETSSGLLEAGKRIVTGKGFPEVGQTITTEPGFALGFLAGEYGQLKGSSLIFSKIDDLSKLKKLKKVAPEYSLGLERVDDVSKVVVGSVRKVDDVQVKGVQYFEVVDDTIRGGKGAVQVVKDGSVIDTKMFTFFGDTLPTKGARSVSFVDDLSITRPIKTQPSVSRITALFDDGKAVRTLSGGFTEQAGDITKILYGDVGRMARVQRTGTQKLKDLFRFGEKVDVPVYDKIALAEFKPSGAGAIKTMGGFDDVGGAVGGTTQVLDSSVVSKFAPATLAQEQKALSLLDLGTGSKASVKAVTPTIIKQPSSGGMFPLASAQEVKQEQIVSPQVTQDIFQEVKQDQKPIQLLKSVQKQRERQAASPGAVQFSTLETRQDTSPALKQISLLASAQSSRQRSLTGIGTKTQTPKVKTKTTLKAVSPKPKPTSAIKKTTAKDTLNQMFKVYKRVKGEDVLVGSERTEFLAGKKLKKELLKDISASGGVTYKGQKVSAKRLGAWGEFRVSKVDPFRLVQKKGGKEGGRGRLQTQGEIWDIGRAPKKKKDKKKGFF